MRLPLLVAIVLLETLTTPVAQQLDWYQQMLPARENHAIAYDEARQRTVLFGGSVPGADIWELDGASWSQRMPVLLPSRRQGHAMAYDAARRRIVLFGGTGPAGPGPLGDTWEWDGDRWLQQNPSVSPAPRSAHALAYDSARKRVVLFGGIGATYFDDTWEWDGQSWVLSTPASKPSARYQLSMTYDSARQRVLLFGGARESNWFSDTWEWDGTAWLQRLPATSPPARSLHGIAYDSARQCAVLFGGYGTFNSPWLDDTWEWDGTTWKQLITVGTPSPRNRHAMTYDAARQRVIVVGGQGFDTTFRMFTSSSDTWEWDGTTWTQRASSPASRDNAAMVYDQVRHRFVLFGGRDPSVNPLAETWACDGRTWTRLSPNNSPSARYRHAMAFDPIRDRIVLFGGYGGSPNNRIVYSDTWQWDGTTWSQMSPSANPGARASHAMAYDRARGRVVLFGGDDGSTDRSDVWEWDGASWSQRAPTVSPPARSGHAMEYDRARQRVVLFGGASGVSAFADTWEWDGTNWSGVPSTTAPRARVYHTMAYDSWRQRVVLFGGADPLFPLADAWDWDGTSWTPVGTVTKQAPRTWHAMAYDDIRGRALLFGGAVNVASSGLSYSFPTDTWVLGPATLASSSRIGSACGGANAVPTLTAGEPFLGNPAFTMELLSANPSSACVFGISASTQSLPLGGGCTLYLRDPMVLVFASTSAFGVASTRVSVPLDPSLRGGVVFAQAACVDPLSPFAGLAFTAGLALTFDF